LSATVARKRPTVMFGTSASATRQHAVYSPRVTKFAEVDYLPLGYDRLALMRSARASTTFEFQLAEKRTQATALHARSMEMKSAFVSTTAGAILLVSAGCTSVQEAQQSGQPSARATMVENANASAQSSTDVSYGGVPDTRTATGGTRSPSSPTCVTRLRCDLFSKH
jgi:hypothetical protein